MHIQEPENNKQREALIILAGRALALSLMPSKGYSPARIGRIFADALMEESDHLMERDLSHECLSLIMDSTIQRLNQHYEKIHNDVPLPLTIYGNDIKAEAGCAEEGEEA